MKQQIQELSLFDKNYKIVESQTHFTKDPYTKTFRYTAECCIGAADIVVINKWVMKDGIETELGLKTNWLDEKGNVKGWVMFTFHDAVCTSFHEKYSQEDGSFLLWFCLEAKNITRSDDRKEAKIKSLLN